MTYVKATKIATIAGINLYEHPTMGDEVPLMFKFGNGYVSSGFYNEPEIDPIEVREVYETIKEAMGNA